MTAEQEHEIARLAAATVAFAITEHRGRTIGVPELHFANLTLLDATRDNGVVRLRVSHPHCRPSEWTSYVRDNDELLVDLTIPRACTPIGGHAPDKIHIGCILR